MAPNAASTPARSTPVVAKKFASHVRPTYKDMIMEAILAVSFLPPPSRYYHARSVPNCCARYR